MANIYVPSPENAPPLIRYGAFVAQDTGGSTPVPVSTTTAHPVVS